MLLANALAIQVHYHGSCNHCNYQIADAWRNSDLNHLAAKGTSSPISSKVVLEEIPIDRVGQQSLYQVTLDFLLLVQSIVHLDVKGILESIKNGPTIIDHKPFNVRKGGLSTWVLLDPFRSCLHVWYLCQPEVVFHSRYVRTRVSNPKLPTAISFGIVKPHTVTLSSSPIRCTGAEFRARFCWMEGT